MKKITQEEFDKLEKEKEKKFNAFISRWNIYIETFTSVGFTKEQARKLASEFSEFKSI